MLTGLVDWIAGRPTRTAYNRAFVEEVRTGGPHERNPRVECFILICWVLIAVKHVAVIWAVQHYRMPFHQLLVNAPTWVFGVLATWFYYRRPA